MVRTHHHMDHPLAGPAASMSPDELDLLVPAARQPTPSYRLGLARN